MIKNCEKCGAALQTELDNSNNRISSLDGLQYAELIFDYFDDDVYYPDFSKMSCKL